ncbi:MAG: hypothetical protein GY850_14135 [bacterium]|nr:hypothetical protein [bacterium]
MPRKAKDIIRTIAIAFILIFFFCFVVAPKVQAAGIQQQDSTDSVICVVESIGNLINEIPKCGDDAECAREIIAGEIFAMLECSQNALILTSICTITSDLNAFDKFAACEENALCYSAVWLGVVFDLIECTEGLWERDL